MMTHLSLSSLSLLSLLSSCSSISAHSSNVRSQWFKIIKSFIDGDRNAATVFLKYRPLNTNENLCCEPSLQNSSLWIHDSAVENSNGFHFTVSPNPSCNGVVRCEDNCDIMTINSQLVTETMRHHSTRFLLCSWAQLWRTNNKRPMSLSPHNQEKISGVKWSYHGKWFCCSNKTPKMLTWFGVNVFKSMKS